MIFRFAKTLGAIASTLVLVACGGGGGGGGPQPAQDQTISFATTGTVSSAVGTSVTNTASGGAGTGTITYVSSNLTVATVNPTTGVATLLTVGTTTITATKSASSGFNQATASYALNVTPGTQTIAFAQAGPLQSLVGATTNNTASGGAGTGVVGYASSNTAVATVNTTTGMVTAVGVGSATITATKAADANYQQAQTTYNIDVVDQATVNAWVGETGTLVSLPAVANGARFTRARDRNCDLANYATCTNGQQTVVANAPGAAISDGAATIANTAYYWLQSDTVNSQPLPVSVGRFSERIGHTALRYNNRYWVIGGSLFNSAGAFADVWSSADGRVWELATNNAAFGQRWLHQSVVYNNRMWVIGGINAAGGLANNVYSSTDGIAWTQEAPGTPFIGSTHENLASTVFNNAIWVVYHGDVYSSTDGFSWSLRNPSSQISGGQRGYASLTVFNGQLWYIGGSVGYTNGANPGTSVNDVWRSSDGITWTQVTASAAFPPRMRHSAFVLNGRLWVFGGQVASAGVIGGRAGDAWSTSDGTNWTEEGANIAIDDSFLAPVVQESDRVTMIGGVQRVYSNGVYQSTNGTSWTELSPFAQFPSRIAQAAVSFLGDLWVIGGTTLEQGDTNDVWRSADGANWTRVTTVGPIFSPRNSHRAIVFNNRLWVIGGWSDPNLGGTGERYNDVWSSADGVNWTQETANAAFAARAGFATAAHSGRLWVFGGALADDSNVNDVWSSVDGITWTEETASAAFTARNGHTVTVLNNEFLLIGGVAGAAYNDEVWRSANGRDWTLVAAGPRFSMRNRHAAVAHNNRIWVIGGSNGPYPTAASPGNTSLNDVWSSADGVTWRQDTAAAQFEHRSLMDAVSHNGDLWVVGGFRLDRMNDVWRSSDGANWRVGVKDTIRMQ